MDVNFNFVGSINIWFRNIYFMFSYKINEYNIYLYIKKIEKRGKEKSTELLVKIGGTTICKKTIGWIREI